MIAATAQIHQLTLVTAISEILMAAGLPYSIPFGDEFAR
jgi:hypothetical protein